MIRRARKLKLTVWILITSVLFGFAVWAGSGADAYAADEIGIGAARLLAPTGDFLKADITDGVKYEFWAPLDTEAIAYGTDDALQKMTVVTLNSADRGLKAPFAEGEVGNCFEIRVKTTVTMYVRRYRSAVESEMDSNLIETISYDGTQYFRNKLDGVSPKISKNTLLPRLDGNVWSIAFSVEDPGSDSQWFWAQSGLKSINIVQKLYPSEGSSAEYRTVIGADGKPIAQKFSGAADGEVPVTRTNFSFTIKNEKGDFYAELTDQVGNLRRVSVLYVEDTANPYFETVTKATKYIADDELNVTLRNDVSNTLDAFLEALNNKWTEDRFLAAQQPFLKAMRAVLAAYEKGKNVTVTFENKEYLTGTFDAEIDETSFEGKLLYGDTLELRVTFAYFDRKNYKNDAAGALAATPGATGVLRVSVKLLYNGDQVPFAAPVKLYLGIPENYRDVSAVYVGEEGANTFSIQTGGAWVSFSVDRTGSYDLFFAERDNLIYLWFLLLILPFAGILLTVLVALKRKKSRAKKVLPSHTGREVEENHKTARIETLTTDGTSDPTVQSVTEVLATGAPTAKGKGAQKTGAEKGARCDSDRIGRTAHDYECGKTGAGAQNFKAISTEGTSEKSDDKQAGGEIFKKDDSAAAGGAASGTDNAAAGRNPAAKTIKKSYPTRKGHATRAKKG